MLTGTITIPELVFSLVAVIGIGVTLWNLQDALYNVHYHSAMEFLRPEEWDQPDAISATITLRNAASAVLIQSLLAAAGIFAMVRAPDNPDQAVSVTSLIATIAIVLVEVLIVLVAIWDRYDRQRMHNVVVGRILEKGNTDVA